MAEKALVVVAAALLDREGSVLVQRRPKGTDLEGRWEFPGGKIEPYESAESALCRELQEELAIEVNQQSLFPLAFATGKAKGRPLILLLFGTHEWSGEATALHASELKWVDFEELKNMPMPEADIALIAQLGHYLTLGAVALR